MPDGNWLLMDNGLDERYRQILDAAFTIFARDGYDGTRLPAIAFEAKVSIGTIYRHFPSKQALFNQICQQLIMAVKYKLMINFPQQASCEVQFDFLFNKTLQLFQHDPRSATFIMRNQFATILDSVTLAKQAALIAFLKKTIQKGQQCGVLRAGLPELLLVTVVNQMTSSVIFMVGRMPWPELVQTLRDCCWGSLSEGAVNYVGND
ncbi:hypothetical protein BSQ39_02030 [Loigolactobacillus backii]|uniref:TetR/AcrR family transcriptional regulator n=1 Tax=Loigolactobacillus backii TaxID=375175 RepID=UPI000C1CA282|nr:TetR/AcrR family transcriptional regulator [Loigolactobacillus backii]PIO82426.1 hypothetical protein BSQ39_02030 [Loigolactobacillus backii]